MLGVISSTEVERYPEEVSPPSRSVSKTSLLSQRKTGPLVQMEEQGGGVCAVGVEEANLPIKAPVATPRRIPADALALRCFYHVIEVANLRLSLASDILELLAACFSNRGSLRSCYGEVAVRSVFA